MATIRGSAINGVTRPRTDVSVITSGHDVADARLHRIVAALIRAGQTVEVLGVGNPDDGPTGAIVRTTVRGSLPRRAFRAVTMPWRATGAVIVCMDPDTAIGCVTVRAVRGRKLVVDVHEDYAALLDDRAWATGLRGWLARRLVTLATTVAARADVTVVADEHVPPPAGRCRRRLVVRNLPDLSLMGSASGGYSGGDAALRAVYVGDVRWSRGLESMIEALGAAPGWSLDIVGPVSREDAPWLEERLGRPDAAGRVRVHGRQPPAAAWRIAGGAAVGLALLEDTPAFRAAMPTKVYEYLAAGMAVLATALPRVERVLAESGAGAVVRDADEAASFLRFWSSAGKQDLTKMRAAARAWADGFCRDESPYDVLASELAALGAAKE
jgi:glycosyltransferase involved in cell wall biosynthesis